MDGGWRTLLPTAFLLTGSDAGARDLLARGLARGPGLDDLVRAHLRRRLGRDTTLTGTSGDPWWLSADDVAAAARLATALDGLTRAERTAVVLRWHEGLPVDRVAALVPGADTSTLPARLGVAAADLPVRLEGLAATARPADLTDEDVAAGVRAVRGRRRTRVLLAVGAVAVLSAGAVLLPDALPGPVADAAPTRAAQAAPALPDVGAPRGSLVDDDGFVAGVRAQLDPDLADGRVLYAGDAVGVRWALVVTASPDDVTATWFTGPAGTAAASLDRSTAAFSGGYVPDAWSAAATTAGGAPAVLVVTRPGDEVAVSPGADVAPDGSVDRTFRAVDAPDGVAAVALDRSTSAGVLYRVVRDDVVVGTDSPVSTSGVLPDLVPTASRSGVEPPDPDASWVALAQALDPQGLDPADVTTTVLGAGSYPAPGGGTAQAVTVAVVLPSGAVVTATAVRATDGYGGGTTPCGTQTHAAGTDPAALTVVTRCGSYAGDSSTFGATVLVVAPPGTEVVLDSAAGGSPLTPTLADGWGAVVDGVDDLTGFAAAGEVGRVSRAGDGPFDRP